MRADTTQTEEGRMKKMQEYQVVMMRQLQTRTAKFYAATAISAVRKAQLEYPGWRMMGAYPVNT